jgi:hypothetical protein
MKYLLNVPLAIGALAQAWFSYLALMPGPWANWEDGPSRGAMAFIMFQPAVLSWLMMLIAGIGAVFADAFEWAPVARRGIRRLATLGATLLIAFAIGSCMIVAVDISAAAGSHDSGGFNWVMLAVAQLGGTIVPLVVMAWLAWLIDAPPARRHLAAIRMPVLAILAVTTLVGGIIGISNLSEEISIDRATSARYRQEEDKNEAENVAHFASLTDASPLSSWGAYATNTAYYADRFRSTEDKMRDTALRRLAARPTLEADIARDLVASDARDSDIAFLLVARVQFSPSAALEAPLRSVMARIVAEIRRAGPADKWTPEPGDHNAILDSYIRTDFGERLAASLVIATKMADSAGVDLRDALRELQSTAIEAYPKTKSAENYQRDVATTDRRIEAALNARRKTN